MDKKKLIAVAVVATAVGLAGYLYLPGFFEAEPPAPTAKAPSKASLPKQMPSAGHATVKKEAGMDRGDEETVPARTSRAAPAPLLSVSSAPRDTTDQTVDTLLRHRQVLKLESEIKTLTAAANRVESENMAGKFKNDLEATKAKVEIDYIQQHPAQYAQKAVAGQPGVGGIPGAPIPAPITGMPPAGGMASEGPTLRMVSVIGNERSAWIEYRGQMQRVVVGDQIGTWKVKVIGEDSVDIESGKKVTRLKFALSAITPVTEQTPRVPGSGAPPAPLVGRPGQL